MKIDAARCVKQSLVLLHAPLTSIIHNVQANGEVSEGESNLVEVAAEDHTTLPNEKGLPDGIDY